MFLATCQNTSARAFYGMPNLVALKRIDLSSESTLETVKAHKEVQILSQLKHINIVRLYHSFYESFKLCLVMEYCDKGDLREQIKLRQH